MSDTPLEVVTEPEGQPIYSKHCVLYIDILGFRHHLDNENQQKIYDALKALERYKKRVHDFDAAKMSVFSDSIVLTSKSRSAATLVIFAKLAAYFQGQFLLEGIMTRGGLVYGDLHHKGDIVFGPALVEAVELEEEVAKYPRIVISEPSLKLMTSAIEEGLTTALSATVARHSNSIFRKDFDGVYHVDIFGNTGILPKTRMSDFDAEEGGQPVDIEDAIAKLMADRPQVTDIKRANIAAKYDWLERYYNESKGREQ